jgi:hypothetical protein
MRCEFFDNHQESRMFFFPEIYVLWRIFYFDFAVKLKEHIKEMCVNMIISEHPVASMYHLLISVFNAT